VASKLSLYNDALLLCGERPLATLTDSVEGRRLLDQVYDNGGVDYCLTQGQWYFALRTQLIDYDPSEDPQFGFTYAFTQPSDWLLTSAISADEYLRTPLTEYQHADGYWYADITPLYVRYVSNDAQYGGDLSSWPVPFKEFVAAYFASKIVYSISKDADRREMVRDLLKKAEHDAKNHSMNTQPPSFLPAGSWASSRRGGRGSERGNRNGPLIG
jgi:hypothetical protein